MAKGNEGAARRRRVSTADIRARKGGDTPIVCLTAYTAPAAGLMQDHVDLLLVGDSVGMVVYGLENTVAVTLDMMIAHGAAVVRGADRPCVVVDLPFGSYQESPAAAFRAAARVMAETGCSAVKLEGGREMAETIRFLVERGVPVMGHVGLTPQHVHRFGGFRPQGRTDAETEALCADAAAVVEAGAFAVVVEAVPENAARRVTDSIAAPTVGIGAGRAVDGQILVTDDIMGTFAGFTPRFVKRYAELGAAFADAARRYAEEVRAGAFPGPEHTFKPKKPDPGPEAEPVAKPRRGMRSRWAGKRVVAARAENPRRAGSQGWKAYQWLLERGGSATYEAYRAAGNELRHLLHDVERGFTVIEG